MADIRLIGGQPVAPGNKDMIEVAEMLVQHIKEGKIHCFLVVAAHNDHSICTYSSQDSRSNFTGLTITGMAAHLLNAAITGHFTR